MACRKPKSSHAMLCMVHGAVSEKSSHAMLCMVLCLKLCGQRGRTSENEQPGQHAREEPK